MEVLIPMLQLNYIHISIFRVWFGPCLMLHFIAHIPMSLKEKLSVAAHLNRILVFVASLSPLVLVCGTPAPFAFFPPASGTVAPPGCKNVDQRTVNHDQVNLYVFQLHFHMNKIEILTAKSFLVIKSFVVNVNRIIWLYLMLAFNNFAKTHSTRGLSHCRVGAEWVSVMRQPCLKQCVLMD